MLIRWTWRFFFVETAPAWTWTRKRHLKKVKLVIIIAGDYFSKRAAVPWYEWSLSCWPQLWMAFRNLKTPFKIFSNISQRHLRKNWAVGNSCNMSGFLVLCSFNVSPKTTDQFEDKRQISKCYISYVSISRWVLATWDSIELFCGTFRDRGKAGWVCSHLPTGGEQILSICSNSDFSAGFQSEQSEQRVLSNPRLWWVRWLHTENTLNLAACIR